MLYKKLFLFSFIGIYLLLFSTLNQSFQNRHTHLQMALPATFQKITAGYLKQVAAEIIFIRTSVFLGGVKPGTPESTYLNALANNFEVMTTLYPEFIDPYFFCQSFLAPISREGAEITNRILERGIKTFPNDFFLRFFYAFNYYRYLDDPLKSANAFKKASMLPNAPPLFGRLAAIFSAEGGNIQAGLVTLKIMLSMEQDKKVKEQYHGEIDTFEKALFVEEAISLYTEKYQTPPAELNDLVPEFLEQLPTIENTFILTYDPPTLRLERP